MNYCKFSYIKIYIAYFFYVLKHKYYVGIECWKRGLLWAAIFHDWQKFTPTEFFAYALYYRGPWNRNNKPEWLETDYQKAWAHHVKYGKHHWDYWQGQQMPPQYMFEMISDWAGTGLSLTGRNESAEWYARNYDKIILHPLTRLAVNKELNGKISKAPQEEK